MLTGITFNNLDYGVTIAQEAGTVFHPGRDTCIARVDERKLLGGIIYTNYTGWDGSVEMHVASFAPRWANRDLTWVAFHYPFEQLRVKKIFARVPTTNKNAKRLNTHLGFSVEHIIRDVFPDGDLWLMSMYRESCRFLDWTPRTMRDNHGRQQ